MAGKKRGIEAGQAYVKAWLDDSAFLRGVKRMGTAVRGIGKGLAAVGGATFGAGLLAAGGALSKVVASIADTAAIHKAGKAFGATAEQATGLFGVFKAAGATNARENIESLVTLSGRIKDVMTGTGEESKKLFAGLSVSAEELASLPIDEQFFRLHEAIMQLPDPIDRVNRLMLAFGEDGGKTLIGTLSKSTAELRAQGKAFAMSEADVEAASRAQTALNAASAAMSKLWQRIAVIVAPAIERIADGFAMLMQRAPGLATAIVAGVAALLAFGAGAVALGFVLVGLSATVGMIGSVIAAVVSPVGLAVAGIAALAGGALYLAHQAGYLGKAVDWLGGRFGPLLKVATSAFKGIKDALSARDLKLAAEIALAGLKLAWIVATNEIRALWGEFIAGLESAFGGFFSGITSKLDELVHRAAGLVELVAGKWEGQKKDWEAQALEGQIMALEGERGAAEMTSDPELAKQTGYWGESDDQRLEALRAQLRMTREGAAGARTQGENLNVAAQTNADNAAADAARKREQAAAQGAIAQADAAARLADLQMTAALKAEEAAKVAAEPEMPESFGPAVTAGVKADTAINTAAMVGSSEGMRAVLRAVTGVKSDPVEEQKKTNKICGHMLNELKETRRKGIVLAEASTR